MSESIAKDVNGNRVAEVFASQATKAMASGKPATLEERRSELESLLKEREVLKSENMDVQRELAAINTRIAGKRLPPSEFRALTERQATLSDRTVTLNKRLMIMKPRIHELRISAQLPAYEQNCQVLILKSSEETNRLLRRLVELLEKQAGATGGCG